MVRAAFLAVIVSLSIVAKECDVASLLDLLVTYQVSVHNGSTRTGFITASIGSGSRSATLPPGATVVVRSFKPGTWAAAVVDVDPELNAALVQLRQDFVKLANPSGLGAAEIKRLFAEGAKLRAIIAAREAAVGNARSAYCSGELYPEDPPADQELDITATYVSGHWTLSGC